MILVRFIIQDVQKFSTMKGYLRISATLLIAVIVNLTSCVRTELPQVSTMLVTNITAISAESGGNILTDGGEEIISCGICWDSNPYPTISDSNKISHTIIGEFRNIMSSLIPGRTYHVRAFATNINGTAYGEDEEFSTRPNPYCIAVSDGVSFYGDVFTGSLPTIVTFEFGKSINYGISIPIFDSDCPLEGNDLIRVGFVYLDGSSFCCGSDKLHFRVKGENAAGVFYSQDVELPCGCQSPMPSDGW